MRTERGSFSLEMAVVAPAMLGLILLVVFAGRYALAVQSVNSAASAAARTASMARTAGHARSTATIAAQMSLASQEISCTQVDVNINTSGFRTDPGQPATVTAAVTCQLDLSGLSMIGIPGSMTISSESSSPLDTYREAAMTTRTPKAGERGSSSLFFAAIAASLLVVVGLVVDGAGMIKATQQADQIAQQAARQAGQQLTDETMTGDPVTIDKAPARVAAEKFLSQAGATGTVSISGTKIRIEAHTNYQPKFLSMIGIGPLDAEGHAEVDAVRVLDGKER